MDRLISLATFSDPRSSNCSQILLRVSLTHGGHLAHLSGRLSKFGRGCCDRLRMLMLRPAATHPLAYSDRRHAEPARDPAGRPAPQQLPTLMLGNRVGTGRRSGGRHLRATAGAHLLGGRNARLRRGQPQCPVCTGHCLTTGKPFSTGTWLPLRGFAQMASTKLFTTFLRLVQCREPPVGQRPAFAGLYGLPAPGSSSPRNRVAIA